MGGIGRIEQASNSAGSVIGTDCLANHKDRIAGEPRFTARRSLFFRVKRTFLDSDVPNRHLVR
ncbi:MAG: hypothetical protein Fues2KO_38360 [Fuerstiella sp.]